jgi:hypothetical protein
MFRLQLVTTPEDRKERELESEGDMLHEPAVRSRPGSPWARFGRIVTAGSFISSVEAALHLRNLGLKCWRCEECDKGAFPKAFHGQQTLQNRGDRLSLAHSNYSEDIYT